MIETIRGGAPITPFLRYGDSVRLEMRDARGQSIFGSIAQRVVSPAKKRVGVIHIDPSPAERRSRNAVGERIASSVLEAMQRDGVLVLRSGRRSRAARRAESSHGSRLGRAVGVLRQRRRQPARPWPSAAGTAAVRAVRVCRTTWRTRWSATRCATILGDGRVLRVLQRQHELPGQHVSATAPRCDARAVVRRCCRTDLGGGRQRSSAGRRRTQRRGRVVAGHARASSFLPRCRTMRSKRAVRNLRRCAACFVRVTCCCAIRCCGTAAYRIRRTNYRHMIAMVFVAKDKPRGTADRVLARLRSAAGERTASVSTRRSPTNRSTICSARRSGC